MNALESGRLSCYNGLNRMLSYDAFADYKEDFRDIFYRYASRERWDLEEEIFQMKQSGCWHQAEEWIEKWIESPYAKIVFHHAVRTIHPRHPLDIKYLRQRVDAALDKFRDACPYYELPNRLNNDTQ